MKYLFLTLLFFLAGCSSEKEDSTFIALGFEFSVKDAEGNDLLDPENPNSLEESKIKLYYVIDGKEKEVYNPLMDAPRNFFIFQHKNEHRICIFVNATKKEEYPITYIKWDETRTDTLKAKVYRSPSDSYTAITKIWLNEEVIWEGDVSNIEPYYEIVR